MILQKVLGGSNNVVSDADKSSVCTGRECFSDYLGAGEGKEKSDAYTSSQESSLIVTSPQLNFGGRVNVPPRGVSYTSASSVLVESDVFKKQKGNGLNYYSTTRYDMGVWEDTTSTSEDPTVFVWVNEEESGGGETVYRIHVNQVDPRNATWPEMFGYITDKSKGNEMFAMFSALYAVDWFEEDGFYQDLQVGAKLNGTSDARMNFEATFQNIFQRLEKGLKARFDAGAEKTRDALMELLLHFRQQDSGAKHKVA